MSSHTMTHLCAQKVAGGTFTYIKALLTLWFDDSRISQIQDNLSKTKQRKRPKGCLYMPVLCPAAFTEKAAGKRADTYRHRRGAFDVARSDKLGNARAFESWNGQQARLHVFLYADLTLILSLGDKGAGAATTKHNEKIFIFRLRIVRRRNG